MNKSRMIESIHSLVTFDMTNEEIVLFEKLLEHNERNSGRKTISSQNGERQYDFTKIYNNA
jgi:hypothetical protein